MTVNKTYFVPGSVTDAAQVNQPLVDVQTESASLGMEHTRTEWVTTKHLLENPYNPIIPYFGRVQDVTHSDTYNNTSWVTISHSGGTTIRLSPGITLVRGDVLRIHGGCQMEDVSVVDDTVDLVSFRFLANTTIDSNPAADVQMGFDFNYGLASRRDGSGGGSHDYAYMRAGFTWIYVCKHTTEVINTIELQVKLEDAANSVDIAQAHLIAIRSTH